MQFKFLPLVVGLATLNGALADTTATIFPGDVEGFDEGSLHGQVDGVGSDGTTYVISGSVSSIPVTATLVEDATHLSEIAVAETAGVTLKIGQECGYDQQFHNGTCTASFEINGAGISTASATQVSGLISLAPVALSSAAPRTSVLSHMVVPFAVITTVLSGVALLVAA